MKHAFSLVELSIVLVVLGLLTGGILTGQSLIRAAELRSVVTDKERYQAAVMSFRDKYFALPGDMRNAVRFWGAAAGGTVDGKDSTCAALTSASPSVGTETCNGDGDGKIDYDNGPLADSPYEGFRAWQHLANAGLVEGSYTGVTADASITSPSYIADLNVPSGKIGRSLWGVWHLQGYAWSPQAAGHYFGFAGSVVNGNSNRWHGPIISPEEAWNIDKKLDDGLPYQGGAQNILDAGFTPNCATTTNRDTAEYNLTFSGEACLLLFKAGL